MMSLLFAELVSQGGIISTSFLTTHRILVPHEVFPPERDLPSEGNENPGEDQKAPGNLPDSQALIQHPIRQDRGAHGLSQDGDGDHGGGQIFQSPVEGGMPDQLRDEGQEKKEDVRGQ